MIVLILLACLRAGPHSEPTVYVLTTYTHARTHTRAYARRHPDAPTRLHRGPMTQADS